MYLPAFAAGLAALMITAAPAAQQVVKDVFTPVSLFQPLTCALANNGSCDSRIAKSSDIYLLAAPELQTAEAGTSG